MGVNDVLKLIDREIDAWSKYKDRRIKSTSECSDIHAKMNELSFALGYEHQIETLKRLKDLFEIRLEEEQRGNN